MSVIHMIPTVHYRQIAEGDRVYGGGYCVGIRVKTTLPSDFKTYHPGANKVYQWRHDQAVHMFGFYERESCAE